jgi:hypothetical protein
LLHQEERRADIDREQTIKILDRGLFDAGGFRHAGIGDENVEPVADDGANLLCQPVRAGALRSAATVSALPPILRISAATASASLAPLA